MAIKENTLPIGSSSGTGTYVRTVSSGGESQRTPFDTFKGAITEDIDDALDGKVDKVTGKGLSTNDFTTAEKNKLAGIQAGAQVNTIETVKVNGTALVPDANKAVNVPAPTVDSALSESSTNPVQNKVITEAVFDLKEDLDDKVNKEGIAEVTPENLQVMDVEWYPNLINESKITDGKYITANGTEGSGSYQVTDYIPVEANEDYFATIYYGNSRYNMYIRWLACYDADKTIMPSAGSDTAISTFPYTVPDGVSFVRLSFSNAGYTKPQFERGTVSSGYHAYGVKNASIIESYEPSLVIVEGQNLLNQNDPDYSTGKFLTTSGALSDNEAYITSGFIEVSEGDKIIGSYVANDQTAGFILLRTVAAYDAQKIAVNAEGMYSATEYVVPSGIKYIRICYSASSYGSTVQICKTDSNYFKPYKPYEAPHYEIKESYLPLGKAPLHVFLPSDIYVSVGRTIELYNEQIVIDHNKYHFRWVCGKGYANERKFSITGNTIETLNLVLYLYDDEMNVCWVGHCTIHVVAASNPAKKILPIGDSLTNWKAWLQETMLLSSNSITWVGTRYSGQSVDSEGNVYASGTIHHEGRSGWGANAYLTDTEYTFDDRYDGVSSIDGKDNPFWDGAKFSLSHYLETQTGVPTPDAVQIFLGTNDITTRVSDAVDNITAMVTTIRAEYPSLPIYICNTIYRSNQNGYGSVGSDAYSGSSGANAWQYDQDVKVMNLMIGLRDSLAGISNLYFIPLASCVDREYDFGAVPTKVNPRCDIEVPMPSESVHPQASGYYQMADLMYSFYCGTLS